MNFGMTNTPSIFVTLMNSILTDKLGNCVIQYLDNIIVFSQSEEQQLVDLRKALNTLSYNSLYTKPSKYEFFKLSLTFLGHIISNK